MPKFTVTSPVDHDGKVYLVGAEIDLKDAQAEPLLELGAIEPKAGDAKKKPAEAAS